MERLRERERKAIGFPEWHDINNERRRVFKQWLRAPYISNIQTQAQIKVRKLNQLTGRGQFFITRHLWKVDQADDRKRERRLGVSPSL
jgi:hypothetical protein